MKVYPSTKNKEKRLKIYSIWIVHKQNQFNWIIKTLKVLTIIKKLIWKRNIALQCKYKNTARTNFK